MEREKREHKKYGYQSRMGKSTVKIDCPFCGETITAFLWSLAGSGKKCTCGALHGHFNITLAPLTKSNETQTKS